MDPCPDIEPEDRTAGQVEKETVKPRAVDYVKGALKDPDEDKNEDFSYVLGKTQALLKTVPMGTRDIIRLKVDPEWYQNGYHDGLLELQTKGEISPNRARELLDLYGSEGAIPVQPAFDAVKIPQHYNTGQIEVANFIADQGLDYNHGNVIKYVTRAGKKNPEKELEDLEKAAAYLQMVYNVAQGLPAVVRDPETREVVWSLFRN